MLQNRGKQQTKHTNRPKGDSSAAAHLTELHHALQRLAPPQKEDEPLVKGDIWKNLGILPGAKGRKSTPRPKNWKRGKIGNIRDRSGVEIWGGRKTPRRNKERRRIQKSAVSSRQYVISGARETCSVNIDRGERRKLRIADKTKDIQKGEMDCHTRG